MSKLRNFIKFLGKPFINIGLQHYYRKSRKYSYKGIEVIVHPEVFPPHLTLSTKILLDFISEIELKDKTFLELGCGCGIISLFASKKGADVTASDINEIALNYLEKASETNNLNVNCVNSNLFNKISEASFDYIIINPPYYPKSPKNIKEQAWYCGKNYEYFEDLFNQLTFFLIEKNETFIIFSEDCNIEKITTIASKSKISLEPVFSKKMFGETNIIYKTNR